jgi:sugar lactone lactonase YvrE
LVTSLTTGRVGQVKDDGTYSTAFPDEPRLVSAIGMYLDEPRNRVLVAISDPGANQQRTATATQGKLARLAIYNRANATAAPVIVELGSLRPNLNHFANDVAVDGQGNAYVTDSFANIIYKVDAQTNTPTVFLEDATRLAPPAMGGFGLNGIVFHPDGYLLVAKSDNGAIYKVPLSNPAGFTQVSTSQNLMAADGMLLQDNNTLQVVSNAQARVFRLATTNGFTSATLSGTFTTQPQFPTTLARRGDASYVLYANLNALFSGRTPAVSQYSINRVVFQ